MLGAGCMGGVMTKWFKKLPMAVLSLLITATVVTAFITLVFIVMHIAPYGAALLLFMSAWFAVHLAYKKYRK